MVRNNGTYRCACPSYGPHTCTSMCSFRTFQSTFTELTTHRFPSFLNGGKVWPVVFLTILLSNMQRVAAVTRGLGQKLARAQQHIRSVKAQVAAVAPPRMQTKASDEDKLALVNKVNFLSASTGPRVSERCPPCHHSQHCSCKARQVNILDRR